jgi:hypothetical protein
MNATTPEIGQLRSVAKVGSQVSGITCQTLKPAKIVWMSAMLMPPFVSVVRAGLAIWLGLVSLYFAYGLIREPSPEVVAISAAYVLAAAGLARGVVWGRALSSIGQLLVTAVVCSIFFGDIDGRDSTPVLERWLGRGLPLWIEWVVLMIVVCVLLAPVAIVGWRRSYFRYGLW